MDFINRTAEKSSNAHQSLTNIEMNAIQGGNYTILFKKKLDQ